MLPIQLRETVLMSCSFDQPLSTEGVADFAKEWTGYPDDNLLDLAVSSGLNEDGEVVCFIDGKLEAEALPFTLNFEMGFLFTIPDGEEAPPKMEELEPTLVWLAYPYMRELVADITGRSPSPQYFTPPLTRLPQPAKSEAGEE